MTILAPQKLSENEALFSLSTFVSRRESLQNMALARSETRNLSMK